MVTQSHLSSLCCGAMDPARFAAAAGKRTGSLQLVTASTSIFRIVPGELRGAISAGIGGLAPARTAGVARSSCRSLQQLGPHSVNVCGYSSIGLLDHHSTAAAGRPADETHAARLTQLVEGGLAIACVRSHPDSIALRQRQGPFDAHAVETCRWHVVTWTVVRGHRKRFSHVGIIRLVVSSCLCLKGTPPD